MVGFENNALYARGFGQEVESPNAVDGENVW